MFTFQWIRDTFWSFLTSINLAHKEGSILFLGLDNAGKTTLMRYMVDKHVQILPPTQHPTSQVVKLGKLTITVHDLGGHKQARRLWKDYFVNVSGIVYMIDIMDSERWNESKEELHALLEYDLLKNVPVAILANKVDVEGAPDISVVKDKFEFDTFPHFHTQLQGQSRARMWASSVVLEIGFADALTWLGDFF